MAYVFMAMVSIKIQHSNLNGIYLIIYVRASYKPVLVIVIDYNIAFYTSKGYRVVLYHFITSWAIEEIGKNLNPLGLLKVYRP